MVRPIAVTVCQKAAVAGSTSPAACAVPSTISVVSDGLAISSPVSAATPVRAPESLSSTAVTSALAATTPATASTSDPQFAPIAARSMLMPTVIRNTPSARPLNGAVIASTSP